MSMVSPRIRLTHWKDSASPGFFPARSFNTTRFSGGGNEPAVGRLQRHAALAQIDDLELRVLRDGARRIGGDIHQHVVLRVGGQEAAIGAAGQRDGLAHGNLAFDAAGARLLNGVVVKVGIAAGLAGRVVVEQGGTHARKVVNWKVMVKGLPSGVNCLPSALQLKMASSVSKLQ